MHEQKLEILFQRYISKTASEKEKQDFFELVRQAESEELLRELLDRYPIPDEFYIELPEQSSKEILAAILATEDSVFTRVHFMRWVGWAAAAIIVFAISGIVFFLNYNKKSRQVVAVVQRDIKAPEFNKATITLSNGKIIILDTVPDGALIAGVARKTADGQLVIEGDASGIAYIITSNPRNSKAMQVILPDKTEVWLNADTKLEYPTNYGEKDRLVSLKGEAVFKVKHNEAKLFKVFAGDQIIEDKGTEFNVKAYTNEESVQTTLLEGAVIINNKISLKPGQQFANNKISSANIEEVMAWKNGIFYLDGRELGAVANELGRWYDVNIEFANPNSRHSVVFVGEIGRNLTLLEVISILKDLKVNCRLEDKKLIVE